MSKLNRDVVLHFQNHTDYFAGIRVKAGTFCTVEDQLDRGPFGNLESLNSRVTVAVPRTNGVELLLTIPDSWVDEGE